MDSETHAGAGQRPVAVRGCRHWRCLVVAVRGGGRWRRFIVVIRSCSWLSSFIRLRSALGGGRWRRFIIVIHSCSWLSSFVRLRSALVFSVAGLAFGEG